MKNIISVLVENEAGILARLTSLLARRGFNIECLSVGPTHRDDLSRITMVVPGNYYTIEQLTKQLYKLVNVKKIENLSSRPNVNRELMLLKVKVTKPTRTEILDIVKVFNAKVVDFSEEVFTLEVTGESEKIEVFEQLLKKFEIIEIAKTGTIAIDRSVHAKRPAHYIT